MPGETDDTSGNMPIEERSDDDRPKGPASPSGDDETSQDGGAMPIDDSSEDDRPKGPTSPS